MMLLLLLLTVIMMMVVELLLLLPSSLITFIHWRRRRDLLRRPLLMELISCLAVLGIQLLRGETELLGIVGFGINFEDALLGPTHAARPLLLGLLVGDEDVALVALQEEEGRHSCLSVDCGVRECGGKT